MKGNKNQLFHSADVLVNVIASYLCSVHGASDKANDRKKDNDQRRRFKLPKSQIMKRRHEKNERTFETQRNPFVSTPKKNYAKPKGPPVLSTKRYGRARRETPTGSSYCICPGNHARCPGPISCRTAYGNTVQSSPDDPRSNVPNQISQDNDAPNLEDDVTRRNPDNNEGPNEEYETRSDDSDLGGT